MDDRGRAPVISTGRGGAGNLVRSPSRGIDPEVIPGAERGREITPRGVSADRVTHAGRGGAGNIRSPSRPGERIEEAKEEAIQSQLVTERRGRQAEEPFSSGRGGAGNIARSRSRSQARESSREHKSGGRGGYGNTILEQKASGEDLAKMAAEQRYEQEVLARHRAAESGHIHTTGKGGAGNVAPIPSSGTDTTLLTEEEVEAFRKVHAHDAEHGHMSGKGGAGNYTPGHSSHLSPPDGERGRDQHKGGLIHNVMRSLSRVAGRDSSKERS
ncbi:hypothetical protein P7C73_g3603, partial [Tremellales sp. Uapishka_1]